MPKDLALLHGSPEPRLVMMTAVEFAASDQSADHGVLLAALNSHEFLGRLNHAHEYNTLPVKQLKVAKVIRTLRDSPHPIAKESLIRLAKGGPFIEQSWRRQELLVRALVTVRPATPPVIAFWDEQSRTKAVNRHIAVEMMCENRTPPALELFERKLLDPEQEFVYKQSWLHAHWMRFRNDPEILRASERMLVESLPDDLKPVLLESLCDYNPRWYAGCQRPHPPPRLPLADEAKNILGRICRHAKDRMTLDPALALAVEHTFREIGSPES